MKRKLTKSVALGVVILAMAACTGKTSNSETTCCENGTCTEQCKNECNNNNCKNKKEMTYSKKYTNADFYKDGKFQQDVAMEAMKDMFAFYDVPFTKLMATDMVNNEEQRYIAHAIYLLPGQLIPEHAHVATKFPAKHESWMVEKGWAYNFSEIGEETPNAPAIPATHGPIKSKNFVIQQVGEVLPLKQLTTFHFLMAGPEGAIVSEWATYHDNAGLRFTNAKAAL